MKCFITTIGDRSTGIYPETVEVEWPSLGDVIAEPEVREQVRAEWREAFHRLLDDKVTVVFEDECSEPDAPLDNRDQTDGGYLREDAAEPIARQRCDEQQWASESERTLRVLDAIKNGRSVQP